MLGVISFLFLKERLTWHKGIGIAFTLLGILALNLTGTTTGFERGSHPLFGNFLIFGAVIGEALFTIFRKMASERVTPLAGTTLMSILGFFMFLPFAIFEAQTFDFSRATMTDWLNVVYYGVVVTVIAFMLWFRGLSKVPASTAAVFTGVWPISAVLLSYIILKEPFVPSHLLGIACVLLGISFIAREPLQTRDRQVVMSEEM